MIRSSVRLLAAGVLTFAAAAPVFAGPPLLCHPYDIGSARSLPWNNGASWFDGRRMDYPTANLVVDTETILQGGTPVVVRMETLRRAAVYASQDPKIASALVERLAFRAKGPDPLAALDAAYIIQAVHQLSMLTGNSAFGVHAAALGQIVEGRSVAPYVEAAIQGRPSDPGVAFAAALIAIDTDKLAYGKYAAQARAGAAKDPLVARNLGHLN